MGAGELISGVADTGGPLSNAIMSSKEPITVTQEIYSARNALTGLTEAARWAGMTLATRAQSPNARTDPLSTSGSHPLT